MSGPVYCLGSLILPVSFGNFLAPLALLCAPRWPCGLGWSGTQTGWTTPAKKPVTPEQDSPGCISQSMADALCPLGLTSACQHPYIYSLILVGSYLWPPTTQAPCSVYELHLSPESFAFQRTNCKAPGPFL